MALDTAKIKPTVTPRPTIAPSNGHAASDGHFTPRLLKRRRKPRKRPFSPARLKAALRRRFSRPNGTKEAVWTELEAWNRNQARPLSRSRLLSLFEATYDQAQTDFLDDISTPADEEAAESTDGSAAGEIAYSEDVPEFAGWYFRVHNAIFDWNLPLPPAHKLVWLCLHRFANNRAIPRTIQKISHERIGAACVLDRRTVSVAIRCLHAIGAIGILAPARTRPDGSRLTAVYSVPVMSDLHRRTLLRAIERVRHEHPDLFLLRPDQARRDRATQRKRAA